MVLRYRVGLFLVLTLLSLWSSRVSTSSHPAELYRSSYDHLIRVNCSQSSDSCFGSLSDALGQAQKYSKSVLIQLSAGTFILDSTANTTFEGFDDLAIIGAGKSDSIVQCNRIKDVGFTFRNCSRITLANVTVTHCGALQNSTSKNYSANADTPNSDTRTMSFMTFHCSLYFLFCSDINISSAVVSHSKGSGLVLYNSGGTNVFNTSEFKVSNFKRVLGGSGVTIDFSFCIPGDTTCQSSSPPKVNVSGSNYTFNNCEFSFNYATSLGLPQRISYPHGSDYMAFGKGGGVLLHLGGQAVGNSIRFNSCKFNSNGAENGGTGFFIGLGDISVNNTISVDDSIFSLNTVKCSERQSNWTLGGGGVKIVFMYYPPDDLWPGYYSRVTGNSIGFSNSHFINNIACYGGAVSLVSSRELESATNSNSLSFSSCQFSWNQAGIAAAVDLSVHYPDLVGQYGGLVQPSFVNCNFTENVVRFENIHRYPMGMGVVYANGIPVTFSGRTRFLRNKGTALVILSTHVTNGESSVMEFQDNGSVLGGAISFIGNAWLIVNKNSRHYFTGNWVEASGSGGAIYAAHFGEHDLPLQQNCFFQYYKSTLPPSKWNSTFTFSNNTKDGQINSIFSTSMLPCVWLDESFPGGVPTAADAFCGGHPWYFDGGSCKSEIKTGPSFLNIPSDFHLEAIPGWPTKVGIVAYDDYWNKIETILIAYPANKNELVVDKSTEFVSNDSVTLYGVENQFSKNLFLRTLDPRIIVSQVQVNILPCPPGFVSKPCNLSEITALGMTCDCVCPEHSDGMHCDRLQQTATLYSHFCLTYQYQESKTLPNRSLPLVIGKCPYNLHRVTLPQNADDLDDLICGESNRTGLLCSSCRDGLGVAVNHNYECVECNPATAWLLFLAVKILPLTLLFVVVAMFNVKLTSSAMNAFVFYGQIVSVSYFYNPHPFFFGVKFFEVETSKTLISLVTFPYGILNLDFFRGVVGPFCIGLDIGTLEVMAIDYVVTIYPMLLIVVCYFCIKLYDRNFKLIRKLWQPFKLCLSKLNNNKKPTTSIIDAFATFLLLSYTNFLYVSFSLLQPVSIYNASDHKHLSFSNVGNNFYYDATEDIGGVRMVLLLFVIVMVVLFVIVPPLGLMLYPLKCFQSCISRFPKNIALKTFVESFTESFRNGTEPQGGRDCRHFAGLYFIFRIAIFIVFVSEFDWLQQYFVQQILFILAVLLFSVARPYKVNFYNYLDIGIFSLLALQNACSTFNSQSVLAGRGLSKAVFIVNYVLLFVPLVYMFGYAIHYCVFSLRCLAKFSKKYFRPSESIVIITADSNSHTDGDTEHTYDYTNSQESQDEFADRVLNPQNYGHNPYENRAFPKIVLTKATGEKSKKADAHSQLEASTENSYLAKKRNQELQSYGTLSHSSRSRHTEPVQVARRIHKLT